MQVFRLPAVERSEEERARRRRSGNRQSALEIVAAGLALPFLYVVATVMMFNDFETIATFVVAASSLACIVAGLWLFTRNRER